MAVPAYPLRSEEGGGNWPAQGAWTYEDYLRLPDDGNRYEVIRGVLYVTAAPSIEHQFAAGQVTRHFVAFVSDNRLGLVFPAPFDVRLPHGIGTPVQPDLVVFLSGNEPRRGSTSEHVPDLVLEILSPSTRRRDLTTKLEAYRDAGIPEYWIVDTKSRSVVVYVLGEGRYTELVRGGVGDSVHSSVLPGFRLKVDDLFLPAE
ncbi:MAG TPA: Uma2 family endonuclease [Thermoanaerobaculia bacterium]|nr:Uma2 family endonuclease [Thermoanaerobaculia bacterium]